MSAASLQVTAGNQPSFLHGYHTCGLYMHSQIFSGDMRAVTLVRLTLTAAPLQHHFPSRILFCRRQGSHRAISDAMPSRELISPLAQASELLPCSAPCCPAGPELSAEDRTDLVLAMVEALIEQGQPHRAEVALQRLQGPGADHSRADSPEVLLRRADMVLKLGHEVGSQHCSCSRLQSVWWRCLAVCFSGEGPPCNVLHSAVPNSSRPQDAQMVQRPAVLRSSVLLGSRGSLLLWVREVQYCDRAGGH